MNTKSVQIERLIWKRSCWENGSTPRGRSADGRASICNINATYLRQIESGAKTPSLQVFVSLCDALHVSPTYLLADNLADATVTELDTLPELYRTATPAQLNLITAMVKSALETTK